MKSVYQQLLKTPYNFSFDQALFILETNAKLNNQHSESIIKIKSKVGYAIINSEVYNLQSNEQEHILWINFLSIAGIQGPLPPPYTEMLVERMRNKDTAMADFLDIFNQRLALLWHKLHKKHYLNFSTLSAEKSDPGKTMLSLAGLSSQQSDNLPCSVRSLMPFFDMLWQRPRSTDNFKILMLQLMNFKAEILPFQGRWHNAINSDLSLLNKQYNKLGKNTFLGKKCWDQMAGFVIQIQLQNWQELESFLPTIKNHSFINNSNYDFLKKLINLYFGSLYHVNLQILINYIQPVKLGKSTFMLGLNTWLQPKTSKTYQSKWSILS